MYATDQSSKETGIRAIFLDDLERFNEIVLSKGTLKCDRGCKPDIVVISCLSLTIGAAIIMLFGHGRTGAGNRRDFRFINAMLSMDQKPDFYSQGDISHY